MDALDTVGGAECTSFEMFWLTVGEVLERAGVDRCATGIERLRVLLTWKRWSDVTEMASEVSGSEGCIGRYHWI